jgi:hypothetical protein
MHYILQKMKNTRETMYIQCNIKAHYLTTVAVEKQLVLNILSGCLYTCLIYVA